MSGREVMYLRSFHDMLAVLSVVEGQKPAFVWIDRRSQIHLSKEVTV